MTFQHILPMVQSWSAHYNVLKLLPMTAVMALATLVVKCCYVRKRQSCFRFDWNVYLVIFWAWCADCLSYVLGANQSTRSINTREELGVNCVCWWGRVVMFIRRALVGCYHPALTSCTAVQRLYCAECSMPACLQNVGYEPAPQQLACTL